MIEYLYVGIVLAEGLYRFGNQFVKVAGGPAVQSLEGRCQVGDGHRAVGAEKVAVNYIVAAGGVTKQVAQHSLAQVQRVIAHGLGLVARFVVQHDFGIQSHLSADSVGLYGLGKGCICRSVYERRDMPKHEIQTVQSRLSLHPVQDIVYESACGVLALQQLHKGVGALCKSGDVQPLAGAGDLDEYLVL